MIEFTEEQLEEYFRLLEDANFYERIMIKKRKQADDYINVIIRNKKAKL